MWMSNEGAGARDPGWHEGGRRSLASSGGGGAAVDRSAGYVLAWARTCEAIRRYDASSGAAEQCCFAVTRLALLLRADGCGREAVRRFVAALVRTGGHGARTERELATLTRATVDEACALFDGEAAALDHAVREALGLDQVDGD